MNYVTARRSRLVAVLSSLLLILGTLAASQFGTSQVAKASSLTANPTAGIPVVHGSLIPPNIHVIPATGRGGEGIWGKPADIHPQTSIEDEPCTAARSTWVHVYSVDVGVFCLGFQGTWIFNNGNGRWANSVNFGNNCGNITFEWKNSWVYENFDQGSLDWGNPNTADLWTLTINNWVPNC
jgi:hypothetical protein